MLTGGFEMVPTTESTQSEVVAFSLGSYPTPYGKAVTQSAMVLDQQGILALLFKQPAQAVNQFFDSRFTMVLPGAFLQGSLNGRNGFPSNQVIGGDTIVSH
jgi:hypothetical protein